MWVGRSTTMLIANSTWLCLCGARARTYVCRCGRCACMRKTWENLPVASGRKGQMFCATIYRPTCIDTLVHAARERESVYVCMFVLLYSKLDIFPRSVRRSLRLSRVAFKLPRAAERMDAGR